MFKEFAGSTIVLLSGGTYHQAVLYRRSDSDRVYAKHGSGYIRIGPGDSTSKPKVSWEDIDSEFIDKPKGCAQPPLWRLPACQH